MNLEEKINLFFLELGLTGTEEEVLNAKEMLNERLYKAVLEVFVESLSPAKQQAFLKVLETNSNPYEEIEKLAASEPSLLSLITKAIEEEMLVIRTIFQNKT